jgi:hypothetical protein
MRKFLQRILSARISRIADRYSSRPDKDRIHKALTELYSKILTGNEKKGLLIEFAQMNNGLLYFQISTKEQRMALMILLLVKKTTCTH